MSFPKIVVTVKYAHHERVFPCFNLSPPIIDLSLLFAPVEANRAANINNFFIVFLRLSGHYAIMTDKERLAKSMLCPVVFVSARAESGSLRALIL